MMSEELRRLRSRILSESMKCSYCGFCEWVCPTLEYSDRLRLYGPRGRIGAINIYLLHGLWSREGYKGIYTCLLCDACSTQCPSSIRISDVIRMFRRYLLLEGRA